MKSMLVAGAAIVSSSWAMAADKPAPIPVYTDVAKTDEDFPLQGEYLGYQRPQLSARSSELVGLQVIALGDGKFEAVKFLGGLPGLSQWRRERIPLKGERTGDILRLTGENYDALIEPDGATLFNKRGDEAGKLRKQHRISPTMGAPAPSGAIVLFDGKDTKQWKNGKMTPAGELMPGTETLASFGEFRMHGEFRLPYKPLGRGQDRGNSGFYLQGRYEVQVLDSFGLPGIENECGALYRTQRPDLNMALPPLEWQTYDIDLTMPKFDEAGKKVSNMRITVYHNGVPVHLNREIPNKTGAGLAEGPNPLPIKLQEHGNPVVYRNIWILPKTPETASTSWVSIPGQIPPVPIFSRQPPCSCLE
jgi:hypothetical protein